MHEIYENSDLMDFALLTKWSKTNEFFRTDSDKLRQCMLYLQPSNFRRELIKMIHINASDGKNLGVSNKFLECLVYDEKVQEFYCFICQTLSKNEGWKTHLKKKHKLKSTSIQEYFKLYRDEYKSMKLAPKFYNKCKLCPVADLYPQSLKIHMYKHFGLYETKCPMCEKMISTLHMKTHYVIKHGRELRVRKNSQLSKFEVIDLAEKSNNLKQIEILDLTG